MVHTVASRVNTHGCLNITRNFGQHGCLPRIKIPYSGPLKCGTWALAYPGVGVCALAWDTTVITYYMHTMVPEAINTTES